MTVTLGKRKRRVEAEKLKKPAPVKAVRRESSESSDGETARALFRRAFEAKFKPLEKVERPEVQQEDPESEDDDLSQTDWEGLSDEDAVQVVKHVLPEFTRHAEMDGGKKAFMVSVNGVISYTLKLTQAKSSKPPTSDAASKAPPRKVPKTVDPEEGGVEADNIKNDLALQRLLKESHLLDPNASQASSGPQGKGRLKALDMRLQDLGAKASILQQEKMPLSHRKGIAAKSANREATRRKEAAENGVILERAKAVIKPQQQQRRERGVGGPGIGKFRGGTLKLSSNDVKGIQGSGSRKSGGKKGRR